MNHPTLRSSQLTSYSSLSNATCVSSPPRGAYGKENQDPNRYSRQRVPTAPMNPSPGWSCNWRRDVVIEFGFQFGDLKRHNYNNLPGHDQQAFFNALTHTAEFRILWPGYQHTDVQIRLAVAKDGRPLTKGEVAAQICTAYDRFIDKARHAHYSLVDPTWRITSSVRLEDLVLVSITNKDGNDAVFQAQVDIVRRV
ncbi:hypothetical protein C8Q74DRAFT_1373194 [Fomes fomentarius]|nr:hypothetical protein C8Q74DRAFT_1373194 [Fomes fomentarius]